MNLNERYDEVAMEHDFDTFTDLATPSRDDGQPGQAARVGRQHPPGAAGARRHFPRDEDRAQRATRPHSTVKAWPARRPPFDLFPGAA